MKPLNSKQRRSAFIKFLFLFLFSSIVVTGTVFFDIQIPTKENSFLRNKINYTQLTEEHNIKFAKQVEKIKGMIDSLELNSGNTAYMEQLIATKLAQMQTSIPENVSTYQTEMYGDIIQSFLELKNAKMDLIYLQDAQEKLDEYSEIIDAYKEELDQTKRDLDICRQLNGR